MWFSRLLPRSFQAEWVGFALTDAILALITAALAPSLGERYMAAAALLYVLACLLAAAGWGLKAGLMAALASALLLDVFFVPPLNNVGVDELRDVAALLVFLAVAGAGASLLALLRRDVIREAARQAESVILLELSHQSDQAAPWGDAMDRICSAIARAVNARGCELLWKDDEWAVIAPAGRQQLTRDEAALANEALRTGQLVRVGGAARARLPAMPRRTVVRSTTFVPFPSQAPGVLRIDGPIRVPPMVDAERLLRACAAEASVVVRQARLADDASRVEALEKADELKTVLLSSVSHDLRSPLTAIKASVSILRDKSLEWAEDERDSFLETIESQTDRLTATVDNLLEMSRIEGGAVEPLLEPVDVKSLLQEVLLAAPDALHGREVAVDAPPNLWLLADYGLLMQSLANLLQNAGKYSNPGCPIRLTAERTDGRVRLSVSDEGPGVPPEELPHIFDKFYRGSAGGRARGTGLGLSIVKAMVELCGGSVTVRSSPAGTVFAIELPVADEPPD
jgi:two-component system sensor histidine kinase KdpD